MIDVGYHWSNLWFAAEKKNWPFARYLFGEARQSMRWTMLLRPVRQLPDGKSVDVKGIFTAIDMSAFAAVQLAVEDEDHAAFATLLQERARGLLFLSRGIRAVLTCGLVVPTTPASTVDQFRTGGKIARHGRCATEILRRDVARHARIDRRFPAAVGIGCRPAHLAPVDCAASDVVRALIRSWSWALGSRDFAPRRCFGKRALPVVVLEARSRPGGRVYTVRSPFAEGLYAEAGAIRIPPQHETTVQLAKDYGLNLVPFESFNGSALVTIGNVTAKIPDELKKATATLALKPDEARTRAGGVVETLRHRFAVRHGRAEANRSGVLERWRSYDQVTWPDWLRSRGASDDAIRVMTLGGDSRELSALYVLRQFALLQKTSQFYKIHGGMDQLPRAMARSLGAIVRYNAAVVGIDQAEGSGAARLPGTRAEESGAGEPRHSDGPVCGASFDRHSPALFRAEVASDRGAPIFSRHAFAVSVSQQLLAAARPQRYGPQ